MNITNKFIGLVILSIMSVLSTNHVLTNILWVADEWTWQDYTFTIIFTVTIITWYVIVICMLIGDLKFEVNLLTPISLTREWFEEKLSWEYSDVENELIDMLKDAKSIDEINLIMAKLDALDSTKSNIFTRIRRFDWRLTDSAAD